MITGMCTATDIILVHVLSTVVNTAFGQFMTKELRIYNGER